MRILIVEDDENLRGAIAQYVSRHASIVEEAADAREAVNLALTHPPDILITDWDLGEDLTGVDVAKFVHKHSAARIVLISAQSMPELRAAAKDLPVYSFLAKPFSLNQLKTIFD